MAKIINVNEIIIIFLWFVYVIKKTEVDPIFHEKTVEPPKFSYD